MDIGVRQKILFISGRPDAHPIHKKYALHLGARCIFEDEVLRWHDKPGTSKFFILLSIVINSFKVLFAEEKVLFTESIRFPALAANLLSFGRKKIVVLMADQSPSFFVEKKFSKFVRFFYRAYWMRCTAVICIGDLQTQLLLKILDKDSGNKLFTIYNGLSSEVVSRLSKNKPDLDSKNIIAVTHLGPEFRLYYKGIDLMVKGFVRALQTFPDLRFTIYGYYDEEAINDLKKITSLNDFPAQVVFKGVMEPVYSVFSMAALHLQVARWDAFPTSTLEALCAGVPSIVSDITGTKVMVEEVAKELVIEPDEKAVESAIIRYFKKSVEEREIFSDRGRKVMQNYTENNSLQSVRDIFDKLFFQDESER